MSTPAHNNDELFRQGLEDHREMPSLKVWEGVEAALDQEKKKRRFLFWLWFGGAGTSLAAALLLIPILRSEPSPQTKPVARTARHVAPTEELALGQRPSTVSIDNGKGNTLPTKNPLAVADAGTLSTPTAQNVSPVSSSTQRSNNQRKHTTLNESNPHTAQAISVTEPTLHTPETVSSNTTETPTQRPLLTPITLVSNGFEKMDIKPYPLARVEQQDVLTPIRCIVGGSPFIQPTLTVQGYSGGVAYQRDSKPTGDKNMSIPTNYAEANTMDTSGKQKKFGVYAGATIKAGLVINRHWYVNVGIGYETHYFADRYRFQVPGTVLNNQDTIGLVPPTPAITEGFTTNTAFGDALIPVQNNNPGLTTGAQYIQMNGKLVYQLHQLILPIDFGYRYSYKRFGVYVGGTAAFHVPLSQRAIFYADSGPIRIVQLNPTAPFNFSLGLEPGVEYNFAKRFSLLAGGTFRYQLLNAHKGGQPARPYVLAGHLGIRVSL